MLSVDGLLFIEVESCCMIVYRNTIYLRNMCSNYVMCLLFVLFYFGLYNFSAS